MNKARRVPLEEIPDPGARGFVLGEGPIAQEIFVVRSGAHVCAYYNQCPHTGAPLDWVPDQFLNLDKTLIQCATHDALFRIEDGLCVAGPCAGQSLRRAPVEVREGWIVLGIESDPRRR